MLKKTTLVIALILGATQIFGGLAATENSNSTPPSGATELTSIKNKCDSLAKKGLTTATQHYYIKNCM